MSGTVLRVLCPAKVNLVLRVTGRRSDGYHELATVFQAIGLEDELEVRDAADWSLTCLEPGVPEDGSNLVLRAARKLAVASGRTGSGARFHLTKRIPLGGGLGGGSSDAAGTLLALDRLWGLDWEVPRLEEIGAAVGADVPFFLHGGAALGTGRGDRITPLPFRFRSGILLGFPPFSIPTAEVYHGFGARLTPRPNDVSLSRLLTLKLPGGKDFGPAVNDLEEVVYERWPELRAFRDALLERGARTALLSGSGSTVFGAFDDEEVLGGAMEMLRSRFGRWRLLRTRAIQESARIVTDI